MRKPLYETIFLGLVILLTTPTVHAISLAFSPVSQSVVKGDPMAVALTISVLGDQTAPSLSTFDVDVTFDPTVLFWSSATFGDPVLGDQLDVYGLGGNPTTASIMNPGVLNLFELSLDAAIDLDTLQVGSFTLATLFFDTLKQGSSSLGITINIIGDANGDPLTASLDTGLISVTLPNVPEPGSMPLLTYGFFAYGWRRRKSVK